MNYDPSSLAFVSKRPENMACNIEPGINIIIETGINTRQQSNQILVVLRTFALIVSEHPYSARKFTFYNNCLISRALMAHVYHQ